MVAQKANRLDFAEIMDRGRIFLARLSHGAIGEENAHLLGALVVSKFNQMAMGRQQLKESDRRHFWLYVDEFQHFATPSMASLLSGVRKYKLGLILAHQELHQLESRNSDVVSAVMGNAFTRVCFRVSDQDAHKLESGFSFFERRDLQNLGTGEAICRVERADYDFNLRTSTTPSPSDEAVAEQRRDRAISRSRARYATARNVVEEELHEREQNVDILPPLPTSRPPTPATAGFTKPAKLVVITPVPAPKPERVSAAAEPAELGRGGPKHRYVQQLIKQFAEGLGYRATLEANVLGGKGIDVALEKGSMKIACEICNTTGSTHELQNVRKGIMAGFQWVAVVALDAKRLKDLKATIESELSENDRPRVRFFLPEEVLTFIRDIEIEQLGGEKTVRGYKVNTSFKGLDDSEGVIRRQTVSKVIAEAMQRLQIKSRKVSKDGNGTTKKRIPSEKTTRSL
jgi:hypothetical protein